MNSVILASLLIAFSPSPDVPMQYIGTTPFQDKLSCVHANIAYANVYHAASPTNSYLGTCVDEEGRPYHILKIRGLKEKTND